MEPIFSLSSKDTTSFKLSDCKLNKVSLRPSFNTHKYVDRIYISNNIKVDDVIHKYDTNFNLIKDDDKFTNYGYPFCDSLYIVDGKLKLYSKILEDKDLLGI
jgi:hypothetical protein